MDVSRVRDRFWNKVNKTKKCWLWTASTRQGYGCIKIEGRVYDAHRIVWLLEHGTLPNKWVLHKCNNRLCVNPEHLYDGSPKDNYWDMRENGNAYIPDNKYPPEARVVVDRERWLKYWHRRGKYLRAERRKNNAL